MSNYLKCSTMSSLNDLGNALLNNTMMFLTMLMHIGNMTEIFASSLYSRTSHSIIQIEPKPFNK